VERKVFSQKELIFILRETKSLNAEGKDCVGRILSEKRKKGIPIDKQAMAIALKECGQSKSKSSDNELAEYEYFRAMPVKYKIVELR